MSAKPSPAIKTVAINEWDGDRSTAQFYVRNVRAILIHHLLLPRKPALPGGRKKGVQS